MIEYVTPASTYAIGIIFPIICTISVVMRLLARKSVNLSRGVDDWMSIAALIFTIVCGGICVAGDATHTLGWHSNTATASASFISESYRLTLTSKFKYGFLVSSTLAIGFVRLTFIFLYRRIFRYTYLEYVSSAMIVIVTCWTLCFFFFFLFECGTHFEANWTSEANLAKYCIGEFKMNGAMTISDAIIDLAILAMPITPVLQLRMSRRRKVLTVLMFSLGIFSVAASLTRMVFTIQLMNYDYGSSEKLFGLIGTADPIGVISLTIWWTYVENGVGCFVSNLPPTIGLIRGDGRILFQKLYGHILSYRSNNDGHKSASTESLSRDVIVHKVESTHENSTFDM